MHATNHVLREQKNVVKQILFQIQQKKDLL